MITNSCDLILKSFLFIYILDESIEGSDIFTRVEKDKFRHNLRFKRIHHR